MEKVKAVLSLMGEEYIESNSCIRIKSYFQSLKIHKSSNGNILISTNLGGTLISSFFLLFAGLVLFNNNIYLSAGLIALGLVSLACAIIVESKANLLKELLLADKFTNHGDSS